jgi:hypothetical protein
VGYSDAVGRKRQISFATVTLTSSWRASALRSGLAINSGGHAIGESLKRLDRRETPATNDNRFQLDAADATLKVAIDRREMWTPWQALSRGGETEELFLGERDHVQPRREIGLNQ